MKYVKNFPFTFLSQNSSFLVLHSQIDVFGVEPYFKYSDIVEDFFHQEIQHWP